VTTVGLFLSHIRAPRIEAHYRRLQSETSGLVEWHQVYNPGNGSEPQVDFEYEPARKCMAARYREFRYNQGVQNGLMDVVILPLAAATGADYVWALEYDVDYTGHWKGFFAQFQGCHADLLSTTLVPHGDSQDWWHWQFARPPAEISQRHWHRAFHPVLRLSRRFALWYLEEMHRRRWRGHYEYTLPTAAHWGGFVMEDVGGSGPFCPQDRQGINYLGPGSAGEPAGSMRWRPSWSSYFIEDPGLFELKDTLYHPVKPDVREWDRKSRGPSWWGRIVQGARRAWWYW
jgi:hypothetical protein